MVDIIAGIAVVLVLGLAIGYIVKAKKSGQKCIGCPASKTCSHNCGCHQEDKTEK